MNFTNGCKQNPKTIKSITRSKATKNLETEVVEELSDDYEELSLEELKARGLLDEKRKNTGNR